MSGLSETPALEELAMTANHTADETEATSPARAGPTTLDPAAGFLVVINTYTVAPERADTLLNALARATQEVLRRVPGFISANFHLNAEHTQLVNYSQWRD